MHQPASQCAIPLVYQRRVACVPEGSIDWGWRHLHLDDRVVPVTLEDMTGKFDVAPMDERSCRFV